MLIVSVGMQWEKVTIQHQPTYWKVKLVGYFSFIIYDPMYELNQYLFLPIQFSWEFEMKNCPLPKRLLKYELYLIHCPVNRYRSRVD